MRRLVARSVTADKIVDSNQQDDDAGQPLTRLATYADAIAAFGVQPSGTVWLATGDNQVRVVVDPITLGDLLLWRYQFTDPLEVPLATYNTGAVGPFQVLSPDPTGTYGDDGVHGTGNGCNFDMRFSPSAALLPAGNASRSISFWFRLGRNNSTPRTNFVRYGNGSPYFGVTWSNSTNNIVFTSQGADLTVPHVYTLAESLDWRLYTATYDGTTKRLYLDNTEIGNQVPGMQTTSTAGTFDMFSSNPPHSNGRHFIDDLRVYANALSVPSISALVSARVQSGPVCRYRFLSGSAADTGSRGGPSLSRPAGSLAYISAEGSGNATGNTGLIEFRGEEVDGHRDVLSSVTAGLPLGASSRTIAFWARWFHAPPPPAGNAATGLHQSIFGYGSYEANGAGTKNGFGFIARSSDFSSPAVYRLAFGTRSFAAPGYGLIYTPFSLGDLGSGAWSFHAIRYTNVKEGSHSGAEFSETTVEHFAVTNTSVAGLATTQAAGDLTFGKFADSTLDPTTDYVQVADFRIWDRCVDSAELEAHLDGGLVLPDLIYHCPPGNATGRPDKSYGYSQWSIRSVGGYGGQRLATSGSLVGTAVGGLQHYAVRALVDYRTRGWNTGLPAGGLYTLAFWFRQTSTAALDVNAFSIGDASVLGGHVTLRIRSGPHRIVYDDGSENSFVTGATPAVGTWQHIAFTADSGAEAISIYYNGAAVTSDYNAPSAIVFNQTNENPRFGSSSGHDFHNVRVYRSRKNAGEIAALYASESTQNPIFNWLIGCRFDTAADPEHSSGRVQTTFVTTGATFKLREGPGPGDYKMNALRGDFVLSGTDTPQGIGLPTGDSSVTVTGWVRWTAFDGTEFFIAKFGTNAPSQRFHFSVLQSAGRMRVDYGTQVVERDVLVNDTDTWYLLSAVYDASASVTRFYKNGVQQFANVATTDLSLTLSGTVEFGGATANIDLADVRVYDAALTTAQILELYNTYT